MSNWINIEFLIKDKKLLISNKSDKLKYINFIKSLNDTDTIEAFFNVKGKEKSLAQLAKLHACIRTIALETGYSFTETKLLIKKRAGLIIDEYVISFADCSTEVIALTIQECISLGEELNINLL
jgi:hypothetical protein